MQIVERSGVQAEEAVRIFLEFKRVESAIKGSHGVIVVIVAIIKGSEVVLVIASCEIQQLQLNSLLRFSIG